jgi:hypothetical protein
MRSTIMGATPTCLVCQKEMEFGFIAERTQGYFSEMQNINLPRWCKGDPKSPMFLGGEANWSQYDKGYSVVAYRCPECQALRLYAPSTE